VSFPFTFYRSFLLERRFSLSTQSFADWAGDQAKSLGLSYAVSLIFLAVFYRSLAAFPGMWWLAVTLIWAALNVFFAFIAPLFIVPLFFKYTPVTDGPAVDRIRSLSKTMGIPETGVFTIDMSRKTVKANAGLMGWGKSRRVVLGDTLQAGYTPEEIEVILFLL
jgi:STE24 endopeptidase